jgi:hypothetical protein
MFGTATVLDTTHRLNTLRTPTGIRARATTGMEATATRLLSTMELTILAAMRTPATTGMEGLKRIDLKSYYRIYLTC